MENKGLGSLFEPKSIAIIGASSREGKKGHEILRNLILSGYSGEVFPVNSSGMSVPGFKTYRDLAEIRRPIDLAVIAIPSDKVEPVLSQCGERGVRNVVIIATGFSDTGNHELEQRVVSKARDHSIRLLGPDSFGIFNSKNRMNCTFGSNNVLPGKTAFVTQSCAVGLALMTWTTEYRYRISSVVSTGTKSDVDDADVIDYFSNDETTASIVIYMEGLKNARKFFGSAREATKKKPIILLKSGKSRIGSRAAMAHTGSVVGANTVFEAALKQTGIIRAHSITDAFDWAQAFNHNPLPVGENVVVVTNCGALGVLASDRSELIGLNLMDHLPEELRRELQSATPMGASLNNPVDLTADADGEVYANALTALNGCRDVHGVVVLFVQTDSFDPTLVADSIIRLARRGELRKPMTIGFMGGSLARMGYSKLLGAELAAYSNLERAVDSMNALIARSRYLGYNFPQVEGARQEGASSLNGERLTKQLQGTEKILETVAAAKPPPPIQVGNLFQVEHANPRGASTMGGKP